MMPIDNYKILEPNSINSDVIIGFFDVIHLGHKKLFSNLNASIITFYKIPRKSSINPFKKRIQALRNLGFKNIYVVPEDELKLTAEIFIKKYLCNAKTITVGSDFKLGCDFKPITIFANLLNINLIDYDETYSTTKIKHALADGDCELIHKLTGKYFELSHVVNHGNRFGHQLGFPTINFNFENSYFLAPGIYYSHTIIKNKQYKSVSVMIKDKMLNNQKMEVLETHILDFNGDLYDQEITVKIIKKINDTRKFNNLDDLIDFIKLNVLYVKNL